MKLPLAGLRLIVLGLSLLPALAVAAAPSIGRVSQMTGERLGNAQAPGAPSSSQAAPPVETPSSRSTSQRAP